VEIQTPASLKGCLLSEQVNDGSREYDAACGLLVADS